MTNSLCSTPLAVPKTAKALPRPDWHHEYISGQAFCGDEQPHVRSTPGAFSFGALAGRGEHARQAEPSKRYSRRGQRRQASVPDEVLVVDERARLRPAQWVESKLTRLLQEASMPVSHLQMRGLLKVR